MTIGVFNFKGGVGKTFARDSLVYELPYLDPVYDYYLKVYSFRETGNDWGGSTAERDKTEDGR